VKIKRTFNSKEEIVDLPYRPNEDRFIGAWFDANGKKWGNPSMAFMVDQGFVVVPAEPQAPLTIGQRLEQIRFLCDLHITGTLGWKVGLQLSILAGQDGAAIKALMDTAVSASRTESNRCEVLAEADKEYTFNGPVSPGALTYTEAKDSL